VLLNGKRISYDRKQGEEVLFKTKPGKLKHKKPLPAIKGKSLSVGRRGKEGEDNLAGVLLGMRITERGIGQPWHIRKKENPGGGGKTYR